MRRVFGLRFLVEAAFIVLVAALVWYEDVAKPWILAAIAGAWLLVALGEWLLSRRERELPRDASPGARHVPGTEPAEVDTPPEAERVVQLPARTEPREWNLWELERVARDAAGADAARDEERSFLLMYLREFADPDGMLSVTFDPLVRETFAEVLGP